MDWQRCFLGGQVICDLVLPGSGGNKLERENEVKSPQAHLASDLGHSTIKAGEVRALTCFSETSFWELRKGWIPMGRIRTGSPGKTAGPWQVGEEGNEWLGGRMSVMAALGSATRNEGGAVGGEQESMESVGSGQEGLKCLRDKPHDRHHL